MVCYFGTDVLGSNAHYFLGYFLSHTHTQILHSTVGFAALLGIGLMKGSGPSQTQDSVCLFCVTTVKLHTGLLIDKSGKRCWAHLT